MQHDLLQADLHRHTVRYTLVVHMVFVCFIVQMSCKASFAYTRLSYLVLAWVTMYLHLGMLNHLCIVHYCLFVCLTATTMRFSRKYCLYDVA